MALTTTTLSAAVLAGDTSVTVTSATGFAAGNIVQIDQEFSTVANSYVTGTIIPLTQRGQNDTVAAAHVSGANITTGLPSDFADPSSSVVSSYPLAARRRKLTSYSAAGAITLPVSGEDVIAVLNGTSVLAMTLAAPTKDIDGSILYIVGNGAAAHTVTVAGGFSAASTGYTVFTVNATAPVLIMAMAVNGKWITVTAPAWTGTVTALVGGIA